MSTAAQTVKRFEQCCPGAFVRRITETDHYIVNQQRTAPVGTRVWYECDGCGRRLKEAK